MGARYSLPTVFGIIDSGDRGRIWFSAPNRSFSSVVQVYERTASPKTQQEAVELVLQGIRSLTADHFVESVIQWGDPSCVADVYGCIFVGGIVIPAGGRDEEAQE